MRIRQQGAKVYQSRPFFFSNDTGSGLGSSQSSLTLTAPGVLVDLLVPDESSVAVVGADESSGGMSVSTPNLGVAAATSEWLSGTGASAQEVTQPDGEMPMVPPGSVGGPTQTPAAVKQPVNGATLMPQTLEYMPGRDSACYPVAQLPTTAGSSGSSVQLLSASAAKDDLPREANKEFKKIKLPNLKNGTASKIEVEGVLVDLGKYKEKINDVLAKLRALLLEIERIKASRPPVGSVEDLFPYSHRSRIGFEFPQAEERRRQLLSEEDTIKGAYLKLLMLSRHVDQTIDIYKAWLNGQARINPATGMMEVTTGKGKESRTREYSPLTIELKTEGLQNLINGAIDGSRKEIYKGFLDVLNSPLLEIRITGVNGTPDVPFPRNLIPKIEIEKPKSEPVRPGLPPP